MSDRYLREITAVAEVALQPQQFGAIGLPIPDAGKRLSGLKSLASRRRRYPERNRGMSTRMALIGEE